MQPRASRAGDEPFMTADEYKKAERLDVAPSATDSGSVVAPSISNTSIIVNDDGACIIDPVAIVANNATDNNDPIDEIYTPGAIAHILNEPPPTDLLPVPSTSTCTAPSSSTATRLASSISQGLIMISATIINTV